MKLFIFFSLVTAIALAGETPCAQDKIHPVVFVPGLSGSVLFTDLDIPDSVSLPWPICKRKDANRCLWIKASEFVPFEEVILLLFIILKILNQNRIVSWHICNKNGTMRRKGSKIWKE